MRVQIIIISAACLNILLRVLMVLGIMHSSVDVDEGSDYYYGVAQPVYAYFAQGVDGAGYYASSVDVLEGGTFSLWGINSFMLILLIQAGKAKGFNSVVSPEDLGSDYFYGESQPSFS